jgi:hypothetical protein
VPPSPGGFFIPSCKYFVNLVNLVNLVNDTPPFKCHHPAMAIFTLTEIDEQMTYYKAALKAVSMGQSFRQSTGISDKTWTGADLPEIRRTLSWLEEERKKILTQNRPTSVIGRPVR